MSERGVPIYGPVDLASPAAPDGRLVGLVGGAAVALLAFLLFVAAVSASFGNADANTVATYDMDEYLGLSLLKGALRKHDPFYQGEYFEHGSFYPALTYGGIRLLEGVGFVITDKLIVVVSRMLSLTAFALLIWFTYRLARTLGIGRPFDLVAPAVMACTPDFLYYAQIIHPDTLQAALIVVAFVVAFRQHDFHHAMGACAILGLATATKLAGLHAIPFAILPASLTAVTANSAGGRWRRLSLGWAGCGLVATAAFFAADPGVYAEFRPFVDRILEIQGIVKVGWGKVEPTNPLLWFNVIGNQYGPFLSLLLAGGLLAAAIWVARRARPGADGWRLVVANEQCVRVATLLLYFVVVFVIIAVQIHMRHARYLQHLLPAGVVVAIFGIDRMVRTVAKRLRLFGPLAGAAILLLAGHKADGSIGWFAPGVSQRETSEPIKVSEWILVTYGPDVAIAADPYTYQAPAFRKWMRNVCIGREIERLERDQTVRLLVISALGSGRFVWKQGPSFALDRLDIYPDYPETAHYLDFIQRVLRGNAPWKIVLDGREMLVLERLPTGG